MFDGQYTTDGDWLYPSLWDGCVLALCPTLSFTGLTMLDWSGNGNAATFVNNNPGTAWTKSIGQNCVQFQSVNSAYAKIPYSINLNNGNVFSEVVWFNTGASSGTITSWNGTSITKYQLSVGTPINGGGASTKLSAQVYSTGGSHLTTVTGINAVNDGKWHCAIVLMTGSTLSLYIDGLLVAGPTATQGGNITADTADVLLIGANAATTSVYSTPNYFTGFIDDVRIYNRILSNDEIWQFSQARGIAFTPSFAGGYYSANRLLSLRRKVAAAA